MTRPGGDAPPARRGALRRGCTDTLEEVTPLQVRRAGERSKKHTWIMERLYSTNSPSWMYLTLTVLVVVLCWPAGCRARGLPLLHSGGSPNNPRHHRHRNLQVNHHGNMGHHGHSHHQGSENRGERELWLSDFTNDFLDEMQADGLGAPSALRGPPSTSRGGPSEGVRGAAPPHSCPPPFLQVPRDACRVTTCRSDKECRTEGHKCCNNGCTFTCMAALPPPPLVDWKKEPPRKEQGISWLLPSTNDTEDLQAERCSTSLLSADEDALLCPHGYVCHIEFLGDAARGIPNRGRCILDRTAKGSSRLFRLRTEVESSDTCHVPRRTPYHNGARFSYEGHVCTCLNGSVECQVGRASPRPAT